MVAGLPGADRRQMITKHGVTSPALAEAYYKGYKDHNFAPNPYIDPENEWGQGYTYETSLLHFSVDDIITILNDLIEEKL